MLSKDILKADIVNLLNAFQGNKEVDNNTAIDIFATKWSEAIDKYVKAGVVNVNVLTTGTAAAQTGTGTGTIS